MHIKLQQALKKQYKIRPNYGKTPLGKECFNTSNWYIFTDYQIGKYSITSTAHTVYKDLTY